MQRATERGPEHPAAEAHRVQSAWQRLYATVPVSAAQYQVAALKLTGIVFDIRSGLRYTFNGPRATHVSLAGVYMA
jgi:hypothetical protein